MTVGELVSKRAEALVSPGARVEFPYGLPTNHAADALVIQTQAATIAALRDLGIWDAEVLECEWRDSACGCVRLWPTGRPEWDDLLQDMDDRGIFNFGDRVRVMVLKEAKGG